MESAMTKRSQRCAETSVGSPAITTENEKADVMEHLRVFDHVGLLCNKPTGTAGLPFIQSSNDG